MIKDAKQVLKDAEDAGRQSAAQYIARLTYVVAQVTEQPITQVKLLDQVKFLQTPEGNSDAQSFATRAYERWRTNYLQAPDFEIDTGTMSVEEMGSAMAQSFSMAFQNCVQDIPK